MQLTLEKHYFNKLMNHSHVFPWRPSEHKSACSMISVSAVSIPLGPCEILEVWILKACLIPTPDPGPTVSGRSCKKVILCCIPTHPAVLVPTPEPASFLIFDHQAFTGPTGQLWDTLVEPEMKPQCGDLRQALTSSDGNGFSAVFAEPWLTHLWWRKNWAQPVVISSTEFMSFPISAGYVTPSFRVFRTAGKVSLV